MAFVLIFNLRHGISLTLAATLFCVSVHCFELSSLCGCCFTVLNRDTLRISSQWCAAGKVSFESLSVAKGKQIGTGNICKVPSSMFVP